MIQNIKKFKMEFFDTRTDRKLVNENDFTYISNVSINRDLQLNNTVQLQMFKNKAYKRSGIESFLTLFNYVKLEVSVDEGGMIPKDMYFSGFVINVTKTDDLGESPGSSILVVIADFAHLFKTTFFTKNITFFDVLQQFEPTFRLLNFNEVFSDDDFLISQFFTPNEFAFIMFAFFLKKFYVPMLNKIGVDESKPIFKNFRIFLPFSFDEESLLASQSMTLITYKQHQTTAFDFFKYLYPEPFFEFNIFETKESYNFMIRMTPFYDFQNGSVRLTSDDKKNPDEMIGTYNVINVKELDFGFDNVKQLGFSELNSRIKKSLQPVIEYLSKKETLKETIKKIDINKLLTSDEDAQKIVEKFYSTQYLDRSTIISKGFSKRSNDVVNLIWTTPVVDAGVYRIEGRLFAFANLEENIGMTKIDKQKGIQDVEGKKKRFKDYITVQNAALDVEFDISDYKFYNPIFLFNYSDDKSKFMSGDISFFGLKEIELRWNFFNHLDHFTKYLIASLEKSGYIKAFGSRSEGPVGEAITGTDDMMNDPNRVVDLSFINTAKISDTLKKAIIDKHKRMVEKQFNVNLQRIVDSFRPGETNKELERLKTKSGDIINKFVSSLNYVVARAYRNNEHLFVGTVGLPVNLDLYPGMNLSTSENDSSDVSNFNITGYVQSVNHRFDFNSSLFSTMLSMNRTNVTEGK
jgi:hypothetical protein